MFGFAGKNEKVAAAAPAAPNGERVVPLHFFDDSPVWRSFILYTMFVFDDVLDTEKLHQGLETLVRKDGWWKLGARLRKGKSGLEYHIPHSFTAERPGLAYTTVQHDTSITQHPIASNIPRPSSRAAVVGDPDEYVELMKPPGAPLKIDDYTNSDRPQLGLHLVSFNDATLVTIFWPHTMGDAESQRAVVEAWTLILAGREDEVQTPAGMDEDILYKNVGVEPKEAHKLAPHRMGTFGLIGFGLGQVSELFRKQETRMLCVPAALLASLREKALAELAGTETPFVTEGDVLVAWFTRLALAHLPQNSSRTVLFQNAYDVRKVLRPDVIPDGKPYVSNAIGFINFLAPVNEITSKPVSWLAARTRVAIGELGTRGQVDAFYAMVRESSARMPPFFGDRGMHMLTYSNWTKSRLFELDFSAAVVARSSGSPIERSGRPRYIQNNQFGLTLPNGFPIIGKDNEGNYWLSGAMNKGHWAKIEELLAQEQSS